MNYKSFGRTGVNVSPLVLGCMMFGGRTSAEDSYTIIDRALDGFMAGQKDALLDGLDELNVTVAERWPGAGRCL